MISSLTVKIVDVYDVCLINIAFHQLFKGSCAY